MSGLSNLVEVVVVGLKKTFILPSDAGSVVLIAWRWICGDASELASWRIISCQGGIFGLGSGGIAGLMAFGDRVGSV